MHFEIPHIQILYTNICVIGKEEICVNGSMDFLFRHQVA